MDERLRGLVGTPFVDGGRNPELGLDCWGLVMEAYKRLGIMLPDFKVGAFSYGTIAVLANDQIKTLTWRRILEPMDYDVPLVVLMRIHRQYITHAGVWVGNSRILHTTAATGAVLAPAASLQGVIVGYYKYVPGH